MSKLFWRPATAANPVPAIGREISAVGPAGREVRRLQIRIQLIFCADNRHETPGAGAGQL